MNFLKKLFREKNNIDESEYFNYVLGVMFTSYINKSLKETRKKFFINESKHTETYISDVEDLVVDIEFFDRINLQLEDSIEDQRLYKFLKGLNLKQKFILYNYYIQLHSENEISKKLGITKQAVNKTKKKILQHASQYKGRCL